MANYLGTNLATMLGTSLGSSLSPSSLLSWGAGTFANASERFIWLTSEVTITGPYAPGVPAVRTVGGERYLQIEGSRTNICLQSESIDVNGTAPWGHVSSATVTANAAASPKGTMTADRINFAANSTSGEQQNFANALFSDNIDYTRSVFHKALSGTPEWRFYSGNKGGGGAASPITATTTWQRYQDVLNTLSGASDPFQRLRNGTTAGVLSVDFFGVQWEGTSAHRKFASSPILTTTVAVTRAADSMSYTAGQVPSAMLSGKYQFKLRPMFLSTDLAVGAIHTVFYRSGTEQLIVYNSAGTVYVAVSTSAGVVQRAVTFTTRQMELTITVDFVTGALTVAGATTGDGTATGSMNNWSSGTMFVGSDSTPATHLYGLVSEPVEVE